MLFFSDDLNNARFAAYRTAMKLRLVQKKLCSKSYMQKLFIITKVMAPSLGLQ